MVDQKFQNWEKKKTKNKKLHPELKGLNFSQLQLKEMFAKFTQRRFHSHRKALVNIIRMKLDEVQSKKKKKKT